MKEMKIAVVCMAFVLAGGAAFGMGGSMHRELGGLLLEIPAAKGGAQGMAPAKVKAIGDWMDNSTGKIGQHRINGLPDRPKVLPGNHRHYRHNPLRTTRALSGSGKMDMGVLNQARLHKIADMSTGTTPTDGWAPSSKRVKEARKIIEYVKKHKRLPKRLPKWVDAQGPMLKSAKAVRAGRQVARQADILTGSSDDVARHLDDGVNASDDALRAAGDAVQEGTKASKALKTAGKAGKIAGPVIFVVECGIRGKGAFDTEKLYKEGRISNAERVKSHSRNGGQLAGGTAGGAAGAMAGATLGACTGPGAVVCVPVFAVIGAVGGGIGGDAAGGWAGVEIARHFTEKD